MTGVQWWPGTLPGASCSVDDLRFGLEPAKRRIAGLISDAPEGVEPLEWTEIRFVGDESRKAEMREVIRAALPGFRQQLADQGYRLIEPTDAEIDALVFRAEPMVRTFTVTLSRDGGER